MANAADIIPNNWIVVMKDTLSDSAFQTHLANRDPNVVSGTKSTFNLGSFKGYSGIFSQNLIGLLVTSLDAALCIYVPNLRIVDDSRLPTLNLTQKSALKLLRLKPTPPGVLPASHTANLVQQTIYTIVLLVQELSPTLLILVYIPSMWSLKAAQYSAQTSPATDKI